MTGFIGKTNYRTFSGFNAEVETVLAGSKAPVELVAVGASGEGRGISGICFGDGDYRKPELLFFALTHPLEFIGAETALDIIRYLSEGSENSVLENCNIWVLPILNPDGYAKVESQLSGGLGIAAVRGNSGGVDLNRNFPVAFYHLPISLFAGSSMKISPYYRGSEPCSEAESQVFRDFILGRNFKITLSLHSFGRSFLFPYSYVKRKCRDHDLFMKLGEEMAERQKNPYSVKPGYSLYASNGTIEDWLYDECGILAMVAEIGGLNVRPVNPESWVNPFFWSNPVDPKPEIENVLPACFYLIEALRERFVE
ncbi:MAG TPA: M14 family zinc carboxypeptidase [bacterium]|nr:M14 family zinc carboxypeptidase [bacterium]